MPSVHDDMGFIGKFPPSVLTHRERERERERERQPLETVELL
jgi:hypothetical protein